MIYITTIAFNNPFFIELQYIGIKKYIQDKDIKFVVFDDSEDKEITKNIKDKCKILNLEYIRIDQNIHRDRNTVFLNPITETRQIMIEKFSDYWNKRNNNSNTIIDKYNISGQNNNVGSRHSASIQYIFNYTRNNFKDIRLLFNIDSDMFFVDFININEYILNYHVSIINTGGPTHIWPNIFIFDFTKCKNLDKICWDGCCTWDKDMNIHSNDSGGETHDYLEKYIDNSLIKPLDQICICEDIDKNLELIKNNNLVDKNVLIILKKIYKLYDNKYLNKQLILNFNNKYKILHLRGYTWTNIYKNTKNEIDNILLDFFK